MKTTCFVENIKPIPPLITHSNGGALAYKLQGDLVFFNFKVYYNQASLANIFSLADIMDNHRVIVDSDIDKAMYVIIDDNRTMQFARVNNRIFVCDLNTEDCNVPTKTLPNICALIVQEQKLKYKVLQLQGDLGYISKARLCKAVEVGTIINS